MMKVEDAKVEAGPDIFSVEDLRIEAQIGGRWAEIVKGISFQLKRGEVLGLVGESGAGKSTIGLAALGNVKQGCRIAGGRVSFRGQDLFASPENIRRKLRGTRIAYVAQSAAASFNPAKRLMDQVTEAAVKRGGQSKAEAKRNACRLFRALQLPDPEIFGDRYPHQVSGGQLQRAMAAMALICEPDLIVFDEPTTALDVTTQVEVLMAVRNAIETFGVAAIYITHDLAIVAQMADRIAVLRYGEIVEQGPTNQILENPRHSYTRSLWAVREILTEPSQKTRTLLRVDRVSAFYGLLQVLDDVSLEIGRAETVALVGESGSGKSTLGRLIAGLKEPESGSVTFDGVSCPPSVSTRSKELLRRIQIIYQSADTALNPRHTVRKIIGRPLSFYHGATGENREARIGELLKLVELDPAFADRLPGQLSGGQRQRVAIARALAANPELIVCDEITSALDQIVQADILKMLVSLQEKLGISYLFITHDIATVKAIANHVVVMHRGQIVEQGPKADVLSPPHPEYTQLLLSSVPEMTSGWLDKVISDRRKLAAA
ncbi:ABC transporter ATP-binding protein [Mesorhizobium sp. RP14(2022)]|uniref:ABC transporter ATP-binding protein n=2 Tax=Mesorhizobium liriopis TaxID=2953882 RepID=A0ABT1C368_9HYPH|nr:ABC transporter ATP-binding protein [Mesorhizobium liriopis]MCO6049271.1 ABC transporter ATP-binding protein [Mesorhizobium liriopis]